MTNCQKGVTYNRIDIELVGQRKNSYFSSWRDDTADAGKICCKKNNKRIIEWIRKMITKDNHDQYTKT